MEKNMKKNIHIYISESLCCTPETQHCKLTIPQFLKKWSSSNSLLLMPIGACHLFPTNILTDARFCHTI